MPGKQRHEHAWNAELARKHDSHAADRRRRRRRCAKSRGSKPFLDRHQADRLGHRCVGDGQDRRAPPRSDPGPSGLPICLLDQRDVLPSTSTACDTPLIRAGLMRPSSRLASVTVGSRAAAAVADRPGSAPGAFRPDLQHAARGMRAMLPPPAPIVWMSTIGMRNGIAVVDALLARSPQVRRRTISETSKLVPPMSQAMRFGKPAGAPIRAAAIAPEAGPDITVCTACLAASGASIMPPLPCMTRSSRVEAALAQARG